MIKLAILLCCGALSSGQSPTATYYVSPSGDDARAGTSPQTAWRTLARVNNAKLRPGDSVLLEGGQTFAGPLVPWGTGSASAPVRYASYGQGRATISSQTNNIVFLRAVSWLTIENLRLTSDGADMHVIVSDPRTESAFVTIRNNVIENTAAFGINSPSFADHDWTIQGNTVRATGETGITFRGAGFKVIGNTVRVTGGDPGEAAHGIYAKGPQAQVIGNVIDRFDSSGISIRYQGSLARGNVISNGPIGISYFQEPNAVTGTSSIAYNRISDVSVAGIFVDDSTVEGFVIANNTIRVSGGNGINIHKVKSLALVNNVVTGRFAGPVALLRKPEGAYTERHNLWYPATFAWEGSAKTLAEYRQASGQGARDLELDPKLDARLAPRKGSPLIDAGVALRWLGYRPGCNGKAFGFCGKAPEIGAVEIKR